MSAIRYDSSTAYVNVPDAVEVEFRRLHAASASTQTLRQYMNASGPFLISPDESYPKPGLYSDAIITQYITDLGL